MDKLKILLGDLWNLLGPKGTVITIFTLIVLIVGLQNMEPVDVDFLFWDLARVPKLVFWAIAFVLGFISGFIVAKTKKE